jgi:flagellar basal body-associated protein FliL
MDSSSAIYKIVIGASAAVAVAAVVAYIFRKEGSKSASGKTPLSADEISKAQLVRILEEIQVAHDKMRLVTKKLSSAILASNLNFEQTYQRVLESQPEDPLQKYGLSMMDFDRLLEREQYDPEVRQALTKLMATPEASSLKSTKDLSLNLRKLRVPFFL